MLFNKPRADAYMRQSNLDCLVACSAVNVTYLSDYTCWLDSRMRESMTSPGGPSHLVQRYAIYPLHGEPALVLDPLFAAGATGGPVHDVRTYGDPGVDFALSPAGAGSGGLAETWQAGHGHGDSTSALLAVLRDRGLTGARIGLDDESLPDRLRLRICESLPGARVLGCSNLLRLIRSVKTQDEVHRLTAAAAIAEEAGLACLANAGPGVRMADLAQAYRERVAARGADFEHFAFGVSGWGIATERDCVLSDRDTLYVDWGCTYRGDYSDTGHTLALGDPPRGLIDRWQALRAAVDAGQAAMRPGARASDVRAAMWEALQARGPAVCHPHGHGLGLEVRDYPILVADNGQRIRDDCVDVPSDLALEADMVLNLEAGLFLASAGSLQIEQSFLVTDTGCRPLVHQDRSAPVVVG